MDKVIVFDIWGRYAHFKKIYATTSAPSYMIPSKTALYGYVGAIVGLSKFQNAYLSAFEEGQCQMGLQILRPIVMQRINTNLRPKLGRLKITESRNPTTIEYVYQPKYRVYFTHRDNGLFTSLEEKLQHHQAVYTPSLGTANLLSNFEYIDTVESLRIEASEESVLLSSVIPRAVFKRFDIDFYSGNEIVEFSQYAVEMDTERQVTKRDDVFLDRKGKPIKAVVSTYNTLSIEQNRINVILF